MLQRPLVSPGHIRCRLRSWKAAVVTNVSPQQWKNVAECAIIGVSQPCQYLLRRWLPLWDVANQEQNEHRDVPDAYKNCQLCHSGANLYISYICLINTQVDLEDKYNRTAAIKWYRLNASFGGLTGAPLGGYILPPLSNSRTDGRRKTRKTANESSQQDKS